MAKMSALDWHVETILVHEFPDTALRGVISQENGMYGWELQEMFTYCALAEVGYTFDNVTDCMIDFHKYVEEDPQEILKGWHK